MAGAGAATERTDVPRLLHRYWVGRDAPCFVTDFGHAWRQSHPHWEVVTWTDDRLPAATVRWLDEVGRGVRREDAPRHRANAVRYWLLARMGGVWVDCDVEPLRVIDDVVGDEPFVATLRGNPEGAVLGAPPGDPFFVELTERVLPRRTGESSVRASGSGLLRRIIGRHPSVRRCPPSMWFTESASGRPLQGDSYTRHLWHSSGRRPPSPGATGGRR